MPPQISPKNKMFHRHFQYWCKKAVLHNALISFANAQRGQQDIDEQESFIDATFASAEGGGAGSGKTKRGKGVKIRGIVDHNGLPLAICTDAANHHEVTLVLLPFASYMIEAK